MFCLTKIMNQPSNKENVNLQEQLDSLSDTVKLIASQEEGNSQGLLSILRTLELLHRQIRVDLFEPNLPDTRKDLYNLLKDIEESGGWPYIERMKLQSLLTTLIRIEETRLDDKEK
jgi:hypothetical protein